MKGRMYQVYPNGNICHERQEKQGQSPGFYESIQHSLYFHPLMPGWIGKKHNHQPLPWQRHRFTGQRLVFTGESSVFRMEEMFYKNEILSTGRMDDARRI